MLKEQKKLAYNLNLIIDLFILVASLVIAYLLWRMQVGLQPLRSYFWILLVAYPVWVFLFNKHGLYSSIRRRSLFDIFAGVLNTHILGAITLAAVIFFVDKEQYSRGLYLLFIGVSLVLFLLERFSLRLLLGYLRTKGYNTRNLVIVGTREKASKFHKLVEGHAEWGMVVLGFVQVLENVDPETVEEHEVLGTLDDLVQICKDHTVDEVVFCLPRDFVIDSDAYLKDLEELGVTMRMVLDFFDVTYSKKELSMFHDEVPILTFHTKSLDAQQLLLKRGMDILGSLVGLTILAILYPFVALAIKRDDPGPVFFGQNRVGENGRIFKCWKFRSMYMDAEERKKELMAQNEMNGAIFKMKDDPRVTRIGKFLRKTSLDEFPQFWNVFRGEMSLVGTRPPTPDEVSHYENWHRRRISIQPGVTGKWQVSGRNSIENFDEIVRLDLDYIDHWSVWLDLKIIFRTVLVVFQREGSY